MNFQIETALAVSYCVASGGTVTTSGAYTIQTFTSSGTFTVSSGCNVDVLVVAGGGGGGGSTGGGGGAGGVIYNTGYAVTPGSYTVTVGGGGVGGSISTHAGNGSNSVFDILTAVGGGHGGANQGVDNANGQGGGSGGGASFVSSAGTKGSGTVGQGNDGGANLPNAWPSGIIYSPGGGGGSGAVGSNGTTTGSVGASGGAGVQYSISGSSQWYAAGGGGGAYVTSGAGTGGSGGSGIGGQGGSGPTSQSNATAGAANTGSGGGGQGGNVTTLAGSGGSGIVIIRYLTPVAGSSVMSSSNYAIQFDSINSGGGYSSSASYKEQDTIGEVGTGFSTSTNYMVSAGYQTIQSTYIAISASASVNMPAVGGLGGGTSIASTSWNVLTDDPAGYTLSVQSATGPAMKSAGSSFGDYAPSGAAPDYTFTVASATSSFGFSPEGSDIVARYKDNGSACNTGSSDNILHCWDGFSTGSKTIAQGASDNQPNGATTTVELEAGIGSAKIQDSGAYSASLTITAVSL